MSMSEHSSMTRSDYSMSKSEHSLSRSKDSSISRSEISFYFFYFLKEHLSFNSNKKNFSLYFVSPSSFRFLLLTSTSFTTFFFPHFLFFTCLFNNCWLFEKINGMSCLFKWEDCVFLMRILPHCKQFLLFFFHLWYFIDMQQTWYGLEILNCFNFHLLFPRFHSIASFITKISSLSKLKGSLIF